MEGIATLAREVTFDADSGPSLSMSSLESLGEILDGIEAAEQMIRTVTGWRTRLIEQAAAWAELAASVDSRPGRQEDGRRKDGHRKVGGWDAETVARRTVSSEIADLLRVPERSAQNMVEAAKQLVRHLPETMGQLSAGTISYQSAQRVVDQAYTLPAEAKSAFDAAVAEIAPELTPSQIESRARRLREKLHPESISERTRAAAENRRVVSEPAQDGMAYLTAYIPVEKAVGIHSRLTDLAYDARRADPTESRTLGQLRADALVDLLIDGGMAQGPWNPGIRAKVLVTVPVLTLLGLENEPGTLEGIIPIAPEVARELTVNAPSMTRLLTHPENGAVLTVGRDRYVVPADLKAWLRVRDGTCRSPGCTVPAARCDIDHTIDWQYDGESNHDNLAHLCRSDHNLKHHTGWRVLQREHGVIEWTSPTGRTYVTRPEIALG